ncbi:glutamate receptor 2.8-like [Ziziphus jujuba]|uniref:Glutamate receptor n=1 Tax=Ziziphus jujuba TaxID=326968 RepID=A0A6P3ZHD4_ZIZJJ|nr:glutamate receptor 2.8-like [Ziziphus jujuba]XP_060673186.1 glutamate receptor 2.8-like [Ziziphus jujuba]
MAILLAFIVLLLGKSHYNELVSASTVNETVGTKQVVRVGVILGLDSGVGKIVENYLSMALSDFYAANPNYQTRLALSVKSSDKDAVVAASAALELMKNEEVQAIIGPEWSTEAKFVTHLGKEAQLPIISISSTSPTLSPKQSPFFIRTCQDDYSQIKPLVSIVQQFGWRQVIVIYEDTEFGKGFIPYLTDALQQFDTRVVYRSVISPSSKQLNISKELEKIKAMETRVLLVHMTASVGSSFFPLAEQAGMMSEGYVWIVTDGLSSLLDPMDKNVSDSMHGVLGVRPFVPVTERLQDFKTRWKLSAEINLFGLWAYDTIWALAKAVESVSHAAKTDNESAQSSSRNIGGHRDLHVFGLKVSESGPRLVKELRVTRFEGLIGEFRLIRGQLPVEKFEIFNVRRKIGEKVIGYWNPKEGIISGYLGENGSIVRNSSSSIDDVKERIIWPGNYYANAPPPRGWVIPVSGKKLRIGVPLTAAGFKGFLDIKWDPKTLKVTNISGFGYDIFKAALEKLPFEIPHEFFAYVDSAGLSSGTYDDLLYQIKLQKYDAVVADTTINANRTTYVDFTLPYNESGVSMVVKVKDKNVQDIWSFFKPLKWDLWLTFGAAFFFTGFLVWIIEHRTNAEFRGPPRQQLKKIFLFSFLAPVFAHGEKVKNNWSRFVMTIWVFGAFIVAQSYTASLASMLTVQRLQPSFVDVNELRTNNDYFVGYLENSYVRGLLIEQLNFNESKLRHYNSPEEYHHALSIGSKNGGVDAIFEEIPYLRVFLDKYCSRYTMVGPTYESDGFGFAFPIGSPLVPYISRAILNVTEDYKKMEELEQRCFNCDIGRRSWYKELVRKILLYKVRNGELR